MPGSCGLFGFRRKATSPASSGLSNQFLLSKGALRDTREDVDHVIEPILLVLISHVHHDVETVVSEVSVEEPVHEEHLEDHVHEAEGLTEPVPERVVVVLL